MVSYQPCRRGYHREGSHCVKDGSRGKIWYPAVKVKAKPGGGTGGGGTGGGSAGGGSDGGTIPNPTPQPITNPAPSPGTATTTSPEPFNGTITPAVAQAGDTGTTEAPPGGDLTGTSQLVQTMSSVFGSGAGDTPQYHYDQQTQTTEKAAQQTGAQPQGAA